MAEGDPDIPWRRPIASLNYLLSSHVWRQDHNGFSHQDPGFIDHVVNKKAEIVRVYLPPDANCLLSVADHCLRSRDYVNVIVAGKQPSLDFLSDGRGGRPLHARDRHLGVGLAATNGAEPDVVLACAGDIPTLETLAAAALLREHLPELRVRVVNVVDLMRLQPESEHPHGLPDAEFDALFTTSQPVIFAYHGYPWLIHRLTYRRHNHHNLHVRGYKEEGTTTTPFDMVMLNDLDRFHLVMDVIDRVPHLGETRRRPAPADGGRAPAPPRLHARARRRPARRARLDLAGLSARPRSQRRDRAASSCRCSTRDDAELWRSELDAPRAVVDREAVERALAELPEPPDAVGHRIVHGGDRFRSAVRLDAGVLSALRDAHRRWPRCTSRSRSRRCDAVSRALPGRTRGRLLRHRLPRHAPAGRGHLRPAAASGASGSGCAGSASTGSPTPTPPARARELAPPARRIVTCHLGAGASLCAVLDGRSVDTTMGFTPLEGLVMATRSGSVDPGLLLWLQEHATSTPRGWPTALEHESGLLGLSGTRGHARAARARRRRRPARARRLRAPAARRDRGHGGGAGRHRRPACSPAASARPRRRCASSRARGSAHLGVALDPARNDTAADGSDVAGTSSNVAVLVVRAREDVEIARQVRALLA